MNLDLEPCRQQWQGLATSAANRSSAGELGAPRRRSHGPAAWRAFELLFALVAAVATAMRLPAHAASPWELAAVLTTTALALAWAGSSLARLLAWRRLRFDVPVVLAQRAVLQLQRAEARATLFVLAVGVCWWLPTALLAIEILGGPAWLGAVDGPWLAANLGFGLLCAVGLQRFARRRLAAADANGRQARWLQLLGGVTLARLAAELADVLALAQEPGPDVGVPRQNTPPSVQ